MAPPSPCPAGGRVLPLQPWCPAVRLRGAVRAHGRHCRCGKGGERARALQWGPGVFFRVSSGRSHILACPKKCSSQQGCDHLNLNLPPLYRHVPCSGYVGGTYYKMLGGTNWVSNVALCAVLFCGPVLAVFSVLNTIAIFYRVGAWFIRS